MSPALRARTRLALLTWRHGWSIRFAHHPLCQRFAANVWRLGPLRVCAGCTCLAAGAAAGVVLGWQALAHGWTGAPLPLAWAVLAAITLPPSWPAWYRHLPPALRHLLRFLAGLLAAATVVLALAGWWLLAAGLGLALLLARALYARNRLGVKAQACSGCEHLGPRVCPGFAAHAEVWRRIDDAWAASGQGLPQAQDCAVPGPADART